jgi:DNA-binding response OmpR family regulator
MIVWTPAREFNGSEQTVDGNRKVLIVEDDETISELVRAILTDEGYTASTLSAIAPEAVRVAINRIEPDCVLLDSTTVGAYGASWETAAWAHIRGRPVPVVMFTAHAWDRREAEDGSSDRSRLAAFAAVVPKPFELDVLLEAVAKAVGRADPFDRSDTAETARTLGLQTKLEAAGATDIQTATHREWAMFRCVDGTLGQIYWWEREGVYYSLQYADGAPRLVGRFYDLDTAITLAMLPRPTN